MKLKTLLPVFALLAAAPADARDVASGYVTNIAFVGARILVFMSGTRSGSVVGCCDRWEIGSSSATDQAQLSIILTAYAAHRSISLSGSGSTVAGSADTEGIGYLQSN